MVSARSGIWTLPDQEVAPRSPSGSIEAAAREGGGSFPGVGVEVFLQADSSFLTRFDMMPD
jgi:hypothetical protein